MTVPAEVLLAFIAQTGADPSWLLNGEGPKYRSSSPSLDGACSPVDRDLTPEDLIRRSLEILAEQRRGDGELDAPPSALQVSGHLAITVVPLSHLCGHRLDPVIPIGQVSVDRRWVPHVASTIAARLEDEAMTPILPEGSIVAIDRTPADPLALPGRIVAACIDGKAVIRWLELSGHHVILRPNLPTREHPLVPIDLSGPPRGWFLGSVVWWWSRSQGRLIGRSADRTIAARARLGRANSLCLRRPPRRPDAWGRPAPAGRSLSPVPSESRPPGGIRLPMASQRASGDRRLNALMLHSREPAFLLDPQGRFAFVNVAWAALTGLDADQVIGRSSYPSASAQEPGDGCFQPPSEALGGRPSSVTSLIVGADGRRLSRRIAYLPFHDEAGTLTGVLGLVLDDDGPAPSPEAESLRPRRQWAEALDALRSRHGDATLVGRGLSHERLMGQVASASAVKSPALIVGEAGTGRRHVARALHARGPSPRAAITVVDVEALTAEALEGVVFDPASGSIAGEAGSTLVLGDALLLPRDLQDRVVRALPGSAVRLVLTTAGDPDRAFREQVWRPDFYYAATVSVLRLSPLRDRLDELPLLAHHFLEDRNRRGTHRRSGFDPSALDVLTSYDWPGNLSELSRVVEAAHARSQGDMITAGDLPAAIRGDLASSYTPPPPHPEVTPLDRWLTQLERRLIEQALARSRHNKSRAAEILDISRPRLYRRIKELNIPDEGEAASGGDDPAG